MKIKYKLNWLFFLNKRGEVNTAEGSIGEEGSAEPESIHDAIMQGMDDEPKDQEPEPTKEPEGEPKVPDIDIEGYKGDNRRSKAYEGERRREADKSIDDPDHEMSFEFEEGKGKGKMKLSELKDTAAWIHQNKDMIQGASHLREMVGKNENFGKIMNSLISKAQKDGNFDAGFIQRTYEFLEGKAQKAEEKVEKVEDDVSEMKELLDDLDPDSPQAQILRKNISNQQALKKQLNVSLEKINSFDERLSDMDKGQKEFLSKQDNESQAVEIKRLSGLFQKEFGILTAKDKQDGYEFSDDSEFEEFEVSVRDYIANNSGEIKSDAEFSKLIGEASKAVYDKVSARREAWVNNYHRKKGNPPKDKKEEGGEQKKKEKTNEDEDLLGGRSIGENIADAFFG